MKNSAVAEIFRNIAELLEIKGDNPFRIRAYLRAAENIENLPRDIEDYAGEGRLREISGIGRDLSDKIDEILGNGKCKYYEELKKIVPEGVVQMLQVPSIGPKTAKLFFDELKLKTVDELEQAAKAGRLLGLPGIREKTVENILKGIELRKKARERMDLLTATSVAESVTSRIKKIKGVIRISWAGSLRRMKETVRDVDILVASKNAKKIIEAFISLPQAKRVLAQGETKSSILISEDVQVDLRVLETKSFGAALLYFTGSKNHNIKLRQLAIKQRLKINEYGVFDKAGRCCASKTEEEMYRALGLDYIAPELREDTGEVEASQNHALPKLLELKDIRGDFHSHTSYSDGKDTVEAMARKAISLGYEYLCLTDHSVSLRVANGLDIPRLMKKKKEIDRLNKKLRNFRILFGSEVEIDSEGRTDYQEDVLSLFDLVVAAIHSGFKQSKKQLTQRIVRACQNKHVHIIAHPTGKLRMARDSYELDFKEVFKAAEETNTALEINAHPFRLDLSDVHARWAKESKVRLAISTDSHAIEHLDYMKFGVGLGRRAWLRKEDVLNSLRLAELLEAIKK
jgi:DNA polymerase (family 10)